MIYPADKTTTSLLIIDAQKEYSDASRPLYTENFKATVDNINKISKQCRANGIPVFIIKHVHDPSGKDVGRMGDFSTDEVFTNGSPFTNIDEAVITDSSDIVIEKSRYSSFVNTNLESYLKSLKIDTLIITGFMSGYCCVTTARHGHDLDYKVIYVNDATSMPVFGDLGFGDATLQDIKKIIATLLAGGVAEVVTTDETLSRLK